MFIVLATLIVAVSGLPVAKENLPAANWRIHITLHVFSGRAAPTWFIDDSHPQYGILIQSFKEGTNQRLPDRLGYRGFRMVHLPPGMIVASGNHVNTTVTSSPLQEMMLLNSADLDHSSRLYNHAKGIILNDGAGRRKRSANDNQWESPRNKAKPIYSSNNNGLSNWLANYGTPSDDLTFDRSPSQQLSNKELMVLLREMNIGLNDTNLEADSKKVFYGAPAYEPDRWNNWLHMDVNNCYNYANNEITDTMAQPGKASNCLFSQTHPTGQKIEHSSTCDGLRALHAEDAKQLPSHSLNLVALVFWPPEYIKGKIMFDFHWYRLDNNGMFSHKPGQTAATNVDNSGKLIKDPRYADRGPYTEFVGFMETRRDKIKII